jgi:hypothetical protein
MNRLRTILVLFIILTMNKVSAQEKNACRYTKTQEGYLMVLRQGDDMLANIENLAKTEHIPSANFSGIGFASEVTFGFYDFNSKKFNPKTFSKRSFNPCSWSSNRCPVQCLWRTYSVAARRNRLYGNLYFYL